MYPSQTSLIPVTVAVSRFIYERGLGGFFQEYPYWYLGLPAKYLFGPVVPIVTSGLKLIFADLNFFEITFVLIALSFMISSLFWGLLMKDISKNSTLGILVSVVLLILPLRYLDSIALDAGTFVIARNLVPVCLYFVYRYLRVKKLINFSMGVVSVLLLIFTDIGIIPILFVGFVALIVTKSFQKGRIRLRYLSIYTKRLIVVALASVLMASLWYGPRFWFVLFSNPSVGGDSFGKLVLNLGGFLRNLIPLSLAVLVVYFSNKLKSRTSIFVGVWTGVFLALLAYRFMRDPDFWMDWSSFAFEIEIGTAMVLAILVSMVLRSGSFKYYLYIGCLILASYLATFGLYNKLGEPKLLTKHPPNELKSLNALARIAGKDLVFVSGAGVFWLNSLFDTPQVRGGIDPVSLNPDWREAAYEFREGKDSKTSLNWAKRLGVKYVLVNTGASEEYYHDFENTSKWAKIGGVVFEEDGDIIYKINY